MSFYNMWGLYSFVNFVGIIFESYSLLQRRNIRMELNELFNTRCQRVSSRSSLFSERNTSGCHFEI